jgi:hypothetical protein
LKVRRPRPNIVPTVKVSLVVHQPDNVDTESGSASCTAISSESDPDAREENLVEDLQIDDLVAVPKPDRPAVVMPLIINYMLEQSAANNFNSSEPVKDSPCITNQPEAQNIASQPVSSVVFPSPQTKPDSPEKQKQLITEGEEELTKEKGQEVKDNDQERKKELAMREGTYTTGSQSSEFDLDSRDTNTSTSRNYQSHYLPRKNSDNQNYGPNSYSSDDEVIVVNARQKPEAAKEAEPKIRPAVLREINCAVAGCNVLSIAVRILSIALVLIL